MTTSWAISADVEAAMAWAKVRMEDLQAREFAHALSTVGPGKPLGAQGFRRWTSAVKASAAAWGLGLSRLAVHSGGAYWVYAWHRSSLRALLESRELRYTASRERVRVYPAASAPRLSAPDVLATAGWGGWGGRPPSCRRFVGGVRSGTPARPGTLLYDLIADAYGDKTGPGRTDVLPGVPRRLLLAVFESVWGQPDPTWIYFPEEDRPTRSDFPDAPLRGAGVSGGAR